MSDITVNDFAHFVVESYMKEELSSRQIAYVKIDKDVLVDYGFNIYDVKEAMEKIAKDHGFSYIYSIHSFEGVVEYKNEEHYIIEWRKMSDVEDSRKG